MTAKTQMREEKEEEEEAERRESVSNSVFLRDPGRRGALVFPIHPSLSQATQSFFHSHVKEGDASHMLPRPPHQHILSLSVSLYDSVSTDRWL